MFYVKYVFVFASLLSIVFVAGCAKSEPEVDCNRLARIEADECFFNKSISKFDSGQCGNIIDLEMKTKCINNMAFELLDYNICKQHDRKSNEDKCEAEIGRLKSKK